MDADCDKHFLCSSKRKTTLQKSMTYNYSRKRADQRTKNSSKKFFHHIKPANGKLKKGMEGKKVYLKINYQRTPLPVFSPDPDPPLLRRCSEGNQPWVLPQRAGAPDLYSNNNNYNYYNRVVVVRSRYPQEERVQWSVQISTAAPLVRCVEYMPASSSSSSSFDSLTTPGGHPEKTKRRNWAR